MWRLSACDIWRDGGSYSATLIDGERLISLWLQVARWDHPRERRYEALFVTEGVDASLKEQRVTTDEIEQRWLSVLECEVLRESAPSGVLARFDEMIDELRKRLAQQA